MNIRDAILKAADHIEGSPRLFNFGKCATPHDCGTPGCALGWIGFFAGKQFHGAIVCDVAASIGIPGNVRGSSEGTFYERMNKLCADDDRIWIEDAAACARGMRLYADKYHPATALIPESVRRIFVMSPAELARELA